MITCSPATFEIIVSDGGKGFDANVADLPATGDASVPQAPGNGLRNMRERMCKFGGFCQIKSAPGNGTTIRFILPLSQLARKGNP